MDAPPGTARRSAAAHVLFALAALALGSAGSAYAWLRMFSDFKLYDDEGYFLVLVRHLLDGRRIYDDVSTVYGPAWLAYRWVLNGLCGVPLATDGVRWGSLGAWIACALLAGLLVRQSARGQPLARWCGLAASAYALLHLTVFAHEPGHPQEFAQLVLLGGLALYLALRERRPLAAALLLGLAIGAQGWTKVNLGAFFALPALLLLCTGEIRRAPRACGWLALAAALALPWLLMRTHLAEAWASGLACVVDAGLLAGLAFTRALPAADRRHELLGLCGGIALGTLLFLGFALARGSTLAGLWHALVELPARFTTEVVNGIRVPGSAVIVAPLALVLALLVHAFGRRLPAWLLPAAELCFGGFALAILAPHPEWLIPFVLPFAWIVLVRPSTRAARLPLVLCAPLQALQVFPVSGSQEALGTILLVPLAALALADACLALCEAGVLARTRRSIAGLLVALVVFDIGSMLAARASTLSAYWTTEQERVALPGVRWTRFNESVGARARFLTDTLRGNVDDFLSVRGDGSQYAWTGIAPATGVIVSYSWRLLDERQRLELATSYEHAPRALLLDNRERSTDELRARLPFYQMLERTYQRCARIGADDLYVRREARAPRLASCVELPEASLPDAGARLELHWPAAAVEGTEVARVQVANLAPRDVLADSALADTRFHLRLWDGAELLFDGTTHPRTGLERLAAARDLRLELPQPLPPEQASFTSVRFFGPDGRRVLSLPVVIRLRTP